MAGSATGERVITLWCKSKASTPKHSRCVSERTDGFPKSNGTYLCLIMCLICLLRVKVASANQYRNRIGQNTGTSRKGNNVAVRPIRNDRHDITLHVAPSCSALGSYLTCPLQMWSVQKLDGAPCLQHTGRRQDQTVDKKMPRTRTSSPVTVERTGDIHHRSC